MPELSPEQMAQIERLRSSTSETLRVVSPAIEGILHTTIPVLDHGFIRVVDYMGDDSAVVQAARVSYGRGTKKVSEDRGLINYLMRNDHTTPFEMASIKLHVKLPIFVARQWIRHRTASVNEYSARYSILDNEFYVPSPDKLATQSTTNRQGRGKVLSGREAKYVIDLLRKEAGRSYDAYTELLNEGSTEQPADIQRTGLARELARMSLSLNFYTQWYWMINLHNLLHFLRLRTDPHAQYEIRAYAQVILDILKLWVPMTHEAFLEHKVGSVHISATSLQVIRRLLAGEVVDQAASGLPKRQWDELMMIIYPPNPPA